MSKYTTGELAKLCGVTVRTVQYYDSRNILIPSDVSEGGRRLYSEEDLQKLRIICFLREMDISINTIGQLFNDADPGSVISILLEQQTSALKTEIRDIQSKLDKLEYLRKELKTVKHFTVESIGDVAHQMKFRKKMNQVRTVILGIGIIAELLETATLLLWIFQGIWWPFFAGFPFLAGLAIWSVLFYYRETAYICPNCHSIFKPSFRDMFVANHTFTTRRLTCTQCGHNGFCVETYGGNDYE